MSSPTLHNYSYLYDKLNRLSSGISDEGFNETINYDKMGNIVSLNRNPMGTNTYSYNGNRLTGISGAINSSYTYDVNGNQTGDSHKGVTLAYNYLNLPETISKASTSETMTNTWLATGAKIRKTVGGMTREYIGGIEYNDGIIEFIQTEEGRAIPNGSSGYRYEYMLKDHLGNTRVLLEENGTVLENSDYYPFGLQVARGQTVISPENRYKYNGKELQTELGLGQYDYGARFYDPVIGRWNTPDPLAELDRAWSPYNYERNNPIRFIDPDGMFWGDFLDENGRKIGTDGKDDRKLYVMKTTQKKFDSGAPSAGITKDQAKATEKFISENSGITAAFDANNIAYSNSVEIEGKASTRQSMVDIVNQDNGRGGTGDANNREYGGVIKTDGTVTQSPAGPVANPLTDPNAHIDIASFDFQSTFHSHPSGNSSSGPGPNTIGGTTTSASFRNAPSNAGGDVANSGRKVNYVFSRGNGVVYIYNNSGVQATIPQKYFVTPNVKK